MSQSQAITKVITPAEKKRLRIRSRQASKTAQTILALYREFGSWGKVAKQLGITPALAWKVAHGLTQSPKARKAVREYTRLSRSSDPKLLRFIRQAVVPWLRRREQEK
ncbi:hypothetical protein MYX84_02130 [Acidobacteria bacterium AH-259-O06]|nr:hypothetical protein [Acidobacteria bacterium AH-259-O06]